MTMYRGRYQQGEEIPLGVLCYDSSGVPTAPDAAPTLEIYSGGSHILPGKAIPALDKAAVTGLFQHKLYLNEHYPAGLYQATYRWTKGGFFGLQTDTFEVMPGGDATGSVVAMTYLERPQASFVLQQRDSGHLFKGKNPRV
jgi:hypothetical protein